jgi:outer membrane protein assembly factor BamB
LALAALLASFQTSWAQKRAIGGRVIRGGLIGPAAAQPQGQPTVVNANGFTDAITHDTKPEFKRYIDAAQDCIRDKDWEKAAKALQEILDHKQNFSVEVTRKDPKTKEETSRRVNARYEANRLLGDMPADGLDTYQSLFGGKAQELLDEAKKTGDPALYADVALRYMHTKAGIEANELLATRALDREQFFEAAVSFKRLMTVARRRSRPVDMGPLTLFKAALAFRRSGDLKNADKTWNTLEAKLRKTPLVVGDRRVSADDFKEMLDAAHPTLVVNLKDWPMQSGNPARNAQADGSAPLLDEKWGTSSIHNELDDEKERHGETEDWVKMAINAQKGLNHPVLSGMHPIAANGKMILRTYDGVTAIYVKDGEDFSGKHQAGELAWKTTTDGGLTNLLADSGNSQMLTEWKAQYRQTLHNIVYENSMVGTLTTDHEKVYAVDDLALPPHPQWMQRFMWGGGQPSYGEGLRRLVNQNTLRAYDLESGKLLWELPDRNNPGDLADTHFLGAPLPVGGKLYALNEKKGELRLLCLQARLVDGDKPRWDVKVLRSQVLCGVKDPITRDISRRMCAVEMAYGEGILVIPTHAGALLGVDLLTQSLVWAYSYREGAQPTQPTPNRWGQPWGSQPLPNFNTQFKNAPPVIVQGKVVFAVPDGASIHCVDLREGTKVWHVKGADDLYLAGVFDNKVLMVGKSSVRALSLDKGKQLWARETGTPCGFGVASKNVYYLPVINKDKVGEICTIDLEKASVRAHNRLRKEKAEPPGNLVFHEGFLLSQGPTRLAAYPQLDVRRQEINALLAKNRNDPVGLAERGELNLADGKVRAAVSDLRKALGTGKLTDPKVLERTRRKLYEAFTELFQDDFDTAVKDHLDEYRAMCRTKDAAETSRRQARFLYLIGRGREKQHNLVDAYKAYVEFAALPSNAKFVTDLDDPNLKAAPDVWVRGRIAAMMAAATPEQRQPLEDRIAREWNALSARNDVEALRGFVKTFDVPFRVGREARLRLADGIMARNDRTLFPEAELALLQLRVDGLKDDPRTMARALEALARLEIRRGTTESMTQAARYYRRLGDAYAKVVVRDGRTGADYFNDLATDKRFLPYLTDGDVRRLTGRMTAKEVRPEDVGASAGAAALQAAFAFEPEGKALPFFHRHRLLFDTGSRRLLLVDRATGEEQWAVFLPDLNHNQYYWYLNAAYNMGSQAVNARYRYFQTRGHMAVVQVGPLVYALDPVNKKLLWHQNLLEQEPQPNTNFSIQADTDGALQMVTYDQFTGQAYTRKIGQVGNLEAGYVCLQTQKGLKALDPLKGTELWAKADVPARTQVFGDDRHVYLVEVRGGSVVGGGRCVRASDGVAVDVPDFANAYQHRLRILGRKLLVSDSVKGDTVLRLYDVHTGKDLWKKTYPGKAVALRSENPHLAGAVQPDGTVVVSDLRTGKDVLSTRLRDADLKDVTEALLLDDDDLFYVALNKPVAATQVNGGMLSSNFGNGAHCAVVNGTFYALDRRGKMRWNAQVQNQLVVLDEFKNVPVVLFSVRYYQPMQGGVWRQQQMAATEAIDKRTGKYVCWIKPRPSPNMNQPEFFALNVNTRVGTLDLVGTRTAIRFSPAKGARPGFGPGQRTGKLERSTGGAVGVGVGQAIDRPKVIERKPK